jgi:hypothetical protein
MKKDKHLIINLQASKLAKMKKKSMQTDALTGLTAMPKKAKALVTVPTVENETPPTLAATQVANLVVEFHNVDAGLSDFTATHSGASQTVHESSTISFSNVQTNDTILISGNSAGSTLVKISGVQAVPMEMNFAAGQHINGLFLIVS